MKIKGLSVAAMGLLMTAAMLAAQERPPRLCEFDGFATSSKIAEVSAEKTTTAYFGCQSPGNCLPTALKPGDPVLVYKVDGDWTCGYLSQRNGAGPGWVRSKDIRLIAVDQNPPVDAWLATWRNGPNSIKIQKSKNPNALDLAGQAYWKGSASEHTGEFSGEAAPHGNQLHFVESGSDSCTVDLTLLGKYLVADDNEKCGGMNVRFWGIWKRAAK